MPSSGLLVVLLPKLALVAAAAVLLLSSRPFFAVQALVAPGSGNHRLVSSFHPSSSSRTSIARPRNSRHWTKTMDLGGKDNEEVAKIVPGWNRQSSPLSSLKAQPGGDDNEEDAAALPKEEDLTEESLDEIDETSEEFQNAELAFKNAVRNSLGELFRANNKNWIEQTSSMGYSEATAADRGERDDEDEIIMCNLGVDGKTWRTGALSNKVYESNRQMYRQEAMKLTARLAVGCALLQHGLKMVWNVEEPGGGNWGTVDSIRVFKKEDENNDNVVLYDNIEDASKHWWPGQDFSFVARNVPTTRRD